MTGVENIQVDIKDAVGGNSSVTLAAGHNFAKGTLDWQEISITLASYGGIDFTQINVPFSIKVQAVAIPLSFDVDAVRWEK